MVSIKSSSSSPSALKTPPSYRLFIIIALPRQYGRHHRHLVVGGCIIAVDKHIDATVHGWRSLFINQRKSSRRAAEKEGGALSFVAATRAVCGVRGVTLRWRRIAYGMAHRAATLRAGLLAAAVCSYELAGRAHGADKRWNIAGRGC
jgi:hypothetical protein